MRTNTERMSEVKSLVEELAMATANWRSSFDWQSRSVPVWEAAYRLKASERTVRRRIENGDLLALKVGNSLLIDTDSLDELVLERFMQTRNGGEEIG